MFINTSIPLEHLSVSEFSTHDRQWDVECLLEVANPRLVSLMVYIYSFEQEGSAGCSGMGKLSLKGSSTFLKSIPTLPL